VCAPDILIWALYCADHHGHHFNMPILIFHTHQSAQLIAQCTPKYKAGPENPHTPAKSDEKWMTHKIKSLQLMLKLNYHHIRGGQRTV